jgi:hypothetical protein
MTEIDQPPLPGMAPGLMAPPLPAFYLNEDNLRQFGATDPSPWTRRNLRMLRHRRLFELIKPPKNKIKSSQRPSVTPDGKMIPKKIASMLASHPPTIKCAVVDPSLGIAAERAADWLRTMRDEEEERHGEGPNGSRAYQEAETLVRDGMLVDITVWDPADTTFPYVTDLPDPMTVFPTYAGNKLIRCTLKYRTTVAEAKELCRAFGQEDLVSVGGSFQQDSLPVEVIKVFAINPDSQGWEVGILIRGRLLTVQPLPACPLTIQYATSRIYTSTTTGEVTTLDRYENIGHGIFDIIEEPIKNKNEDYTLLREMMMREANPPRVIFTDDEGKLDELKFETGQNIHLWSDDKFQLVQLTPDFNKLKNILQLDQQGLDRGSIPAALWGENPDGTSSPTEFMLLGNARDQVYVFEKALKRFYQSKYRKMLTLYRDQSPALFPGSPGATPLQTTDPNSGIKLGGVPFTVQDISALGPNPKVIVEYTEITPQNEVARTQMATNLVREKIIDLATAREMIPAPFNQQPQLMGQRVLQDISLTNPLMTQIMSMAAALYSPDPIMQSIAHLMLPGMLEQAQMQAAGGMGPPATPQPGQNGVPARQGQMAPQANPPENGQRAGVPEGHPVTPPQGSPPHP